MTVAFDTIDRLIVIIIFIEAAMDQVGRGTGPRTLLVRTTTRTSLARIPPKPSLVRTVTKKNLIAPGSQTAGVARTKSLQS